jgi:siroheme synthase-like protein
VSSTFGLPVILGGGALQALVVGAGDVATRKVIALLDGGATVRVRAPVVSDLLRERAHHDEHLLIERYVYDSAAIRDATVVVAATDDHDVNAQVAADAQAAHRLILVADKPAAGNCIMPAVHRSGDLIVAVSSGGVPGASARVRDELARRLDHRYAAAIRDLARLRQRLLGADDAATWHSAARTLIADDFCESVETGAFSERIAAWR